MFKTHFWDAFAERQLKALAEEVGNGDIYIFSNFAASPAFSWSNLKVLQVSDSDFCELNLPLFPNRERYLWYNNDYPLYYARKRLPQYEYYCQVEYDVVVKADLNGLLTCANKQELDFIAHTIETPLALWHWTKTAEGYYESGSTIQKTLNCFSVFSARAIDYLYSRRMAHHAIYLDQKRADWPFSELFVPTELVSSGFKFGELRSFGDTSEYRWWPPHREAVLPFLNKPYFLHPVLDDSSYAQSIKKYAPVAGG